MFCLIVFIFLFMDSLMAQPVEFFFAMGISIFGNKKALVFSPTAKMMKDAPQAKTWTYLGWRDNKVKRRAWDVLKLAHMVWVERPLFLSYLGGTANVKPLQLFKHKTETRLREWLILNRALAPTVLALLALHEQ